MSVWVEMGRNVVVCDDFAMNWCFIEVFVGEAREERHGLNIHLPPDGANLLRHGMRDIVGLGMLLPARSSEHLHTRDTLGWPMIPHSM